MALYGVGFNSFGQLSACSSDGSANVTDHSSKTSPVILSIQSCATSASAAGTASESDSLSVTTSPASSLPAKNVSIAWNRILIISKAGSIHILGDNRTSLDLTVSCSSGGTLTWDETFVLDDSGHCTMAFNKSSHSIPVETPSQSEDSLCIEADGQLKCISGGGSHVVGLTVSEKAVLLQRAPTPLFRPMANLSVAVKSVSCGNEHVLILSKIGVVFSLGTGSRGQLGHGNVESQSEPRVLSALEGVSINKIAAGGWHSAAVSDIGDVYTWGWNERGQLGQPSKNIQSEQISKESNRNKRECPFKDGNISKVLKRMEERQETPSMESEVSESATEREPCLEEPDDNGATCNVAPVNIQAFPMVLDLLSPSGKFILFRDVSCGSRHSAAVTDEGDLYSWGWNDYGQLGHGDLISRDQPTLVNYFSTNLLKVQSVYCGSWNTVVETKLQ